VTITSFVSDSNGNKNDDLQISQDQFGSKNTFIILKFSCISQLPSGASIVPILSLPIQLKHMNDLPVVDPYISSNHTSTSLYEIIQSSDSLCAQCIRIITNDISDNSLCSACKSCVVFECSGTLGIGGKIWDATYGLVRYLNSHSDLICNKNVIELGSGTGLAGILT
jgi:hypothetical protein